MSNVTLPSISSQGSLSKYLIEIRKFPMLKLEEEYTLAKSWKEKRYSFCSQTSYLTFEA